MIINYSRYDRHQIIEFNDNLLYQTSSIILVFRGVGSYTKPESNISYTKNESNISYTKLESNISYT